MCPWTLNLVSSHSSQPFTYKFALIAQGTGGLAKGLADVVWRRLTERSSSMMPLEAGCRPPPEAALVSP